MSNNENTEPLFAIIPDDEELDKLFKDFENAEDVKEKEMKLRLWLYIKSLKDLLKLGIINKLEYKILHKRVRKKINNI